MAQLQALHTLQGMGGIQVCLHCLLYCHAFTHTMSCITSLQTLENTCFTFAISAIEYRSAAGILSHVTAELKPILHCSIYCCGSWR